MSQILLVFVALVAVARLCHSGVPPDLTLKLDQCSCQNGLSFSASVGSLSLDIQDTNSFSCATEPNFGKAALPGVVVNPNSGSEALRSSLVNISTFSGSGNVAIAAYVRPLGFLTGLPSRSASLVEVRGSEGPGVAVPKLLCGLSTSPLDPNKMTVFVVSELLGLEVPFLFDFISGSERENYFEVICGLRAEGAYACFGTMCELRDLSLIGFTLGSFASTESVVAIGSSFSAKQFTTISDVEIVEFAFFSGTVSETTTNDFPAREGIPAPKTNEQFVTSEDSGTVSLSSLGNAANDPFSLAVSTVFRIISLPPASAGVLQDNGVTITTLPYNSTDLLANLAFVPATNYYTASTSCSSAGDFIELLQFQVFDSGLDHACVLDPAAVNFCSTQVNDDPVIGPNAFVVDSTEKVKLNFGITDADDIVLNGQPTGTGLAGGQITFSTNPGITQGTLFTCDAGGSCTSTTIDTTSAMIPIVDELCICYIRPGTLTGGSPGIAGTDDVRVSVEDADGSVVGPVDVEIQIRELVSTCLDAADCTQVTNEGVSVLFTLNATSVLNKEITFSIKDLPLNGLLLQDGLSVVKDADLTSAVLEYRPRSGYYNVNSGLVSVDGTGTSICSGTPPCLDSLNFTAKTDDGSSKVDTFTFAVIAVNDEFPQVAVPAIFDLEKGNARELANVNIVLGTDRDMFEQVVNLTFVGGLQYDLDTAVAVSKGTGTVGSNVVVVETTPTCVVTSAVFCTGFISLRGYPTHLNDALDGMKVFSDADSLDNAEIIVTIVDGSASQTRSFFIRYTVVDNLNDIVGIVAGVIGGITVASVMGFLFVKYNRRSKARSILQRADMEEKMESMTGARAKEQAAPPPKPTKKPKKPKARKEKVKTPAPPTEPKSGGRRSKPQKRKEPRPPPQPKA